VEAMHGWLQKRLGDRYTLGHDESQEELFDALCLEFRVVNDHFASTEETGCLEAGEDARDVDAENETALRHAVKGWPRVSEDPTLSKAPGRFSKAYPLKFPMGEAELFDPERPTKVTPHEWVQHLLRYWTGQFVDGLTGQRVVWAMVNTVLLAEAAGKGFAVRRNVMKRVGWRIVGSEVLTRGALKAMMEEEQALRAMVHQLMTVGRDVRSTPMQWAWEAKKQDAIVKFLSWRPPWVRCPADPGDDELDRLLLGPCSEAILDYLGLDRMPSYWWTLNCRYNYAYEIHRMNVASVFALEKARAYEDPAKRKDELERLGVMNEACASAVGSFRDNDKRTRFDFTRDATDISAMMLWLCAPSCV
jgi:hypothetical protein